MILASLDPVALLACAVAALAMFVPWTRVRDRAVYLAIGIFAAPFAAAAAEPLPRGEEILRRFDALDALLVEHGFPPTSPWWRETIGAFYKSTCRQLVLRVGRRGGKSSTLCRIAVVEALYGGHVIPPGDVGIVGLVSVSREEATSRLRTIRAILDVLRIDYRPIDSGIELVDRRIAFKVHAATVGGVVGGTWICAICDEVARWRDTESGTNPAREVLSSLRPSLASQRNARLFLSSSPLSVEDAHARAFEDGSDAFQIAAHAPTWIANPTITEEETHSLEKDPKVWSREYAAEPQQSISAAFDVDLVRASVRSAGPFTPWPPPLLLLDSSAGRGDAFTWCAAQVFRDQTGRERIRIGHAAAFDGRFHRDLTSDQVIDHIGSRARSLLNVTLAVGDGYNAFFIVSALARHGIRYESLAWM